MIDPLAHDLAVIARLETLGRAVGFAAAPPGALEAVQAGGAGYFLVYPIGGGDRTGSMSDPYADATLVYQVTVVASTPHEVRHLVGQIEDTLAGLEVGGRAVWDVQPDDLEGVYVDTDLTPAPFYATPRYRIRSTPA